MSVSSFLSTYSLDSVPIATWLVELDGTIRAANAAAARLEAPDDSLCRLAPELADRWPTAIANARAHGQTVEELRSGTRHLQLVFSIAHVEDRELAQVMAIDLTARIGVDEQHAAKQRLESLGLVAGGIAHDFNNLLVGVLAEASAAREDGRLAESTRDALRRIEASARRMSQLTRQLLAYAGRGQFVTIPTCADELVGELGESLVRIVKPPLALEVVPGAPGHVVEADHGLLRQVVLNLVANAAEAARSRVSVTTRVVSRDSAPSWQLEIADDGPGIAGPTLARIFEPFFSTKPGHHGLGLSAVHGIVRRLGGDVEVDTVQGSGARFRVRLPIVPGVEPVRRLPTESNMAPQKLAGLRALVADDEPSVRATVRRLLERRGASVVVASDGLEAEAHLRESKFDLVVLDVSMPGRTGHEVLVVARALHPGVPVVLMSGYTEHLRGEGSEEEADIFLEKPFTARILDSAIDDVLKGKRTTLE